MGGGNFHLLIDPDSQEELANLLLSSLYLPLQIFGTHAYTALPPPARTASLALISSSIKDIQLSLLKRLFYFCPTQNDSHLINIFIGFDTKNNQNTFDKTITTTGDTPPFDLLNSFPAFLVKTDITNVHTMDYSMVKI